MPMIGNRLLDGVGHAAGEGSRRHLGRRRLCRPRRVQLRLHLEPRMPRMISYITSYIVTSRLSHAGTTTTSSLEYHFVVDPEHVRAYETFGA